MNRIKILISFDLPTVYIKKIDNVSANVKVLQSQQKKELLSLIDDVDVLFAGIFSLKMFLAARKLKWIQTTSAGVDRFLFPEVVESQVVITNAGGVYTTPVSEHVMGMMISFCRKLHFFIRNQMKREWEANESTLLGQIEELSGKTVGIVGLGKIGREIARKARCLGMGVIATRRNPSASTYSYINKLIRPENLKELLAQSDFVILSLPLTKETEGMIGEAQLRSMKTKSYLINISRGKIVQEAKLIQALKEEWIAGAGLDVFETEPLPEDSELWKMKNVIITPHIGGVTPYHLKRLTHIFCQNLKRFTSNKPLINIVDKTVGY